MEKFINRKWFIAALGILFLIIVLTHIPQSKITQRINTAYLDKVLHIVAYGILGYMLLRAIRLRSKFISLLIVLGLITVIGAIDESTQPLVQRTASVADWFADCGGVCIAGIYNICRNTS